MLAEHFKDHKHKVKYPVMVDRKYNGIRQVTTRGGPTTRKGEIIHTAPHIFEALKPRFERFPGLVLDGELYNHEYELRAKIAGLAEENFERIFLENKIKDIRTYSDSVLKELKKEQYRITRNKLIADNALDILNTETEMRYLKNSETELEKELESLTGKKLDSDTEDIVTDTETDSSIEQNPKTSGKSNQDENKTPNPVNILNSLDKDHSPALLRIALKYAESHKDQFGDKIETIKNKLKSPEINKDDLNENDLIRLLQRRAGLI
jgi:hypothetical protein